jgi:hypothetical protein
MRVSCLSGLCLVCVLSLSILAQDTPPLKKPPQLTMDDLDNRGVAAPTSSSRPLVVSDPPAATTPEKNPAPAARAAAGAGAILDAAWNKMANLKAGRVAATYQAVNGAGESFYYEFTAPDRLRMVKKDSEIIVIAATLYVKVPGQAWKQMPSKQGFTTSEMSFKALAKSFANVRSQVQLVGEELLNQVPMLKLRVSEKNGNDGYLWVGKADGLIYQMEGTASTRGDSVKIVFSHFNDVPAIVPPEQ